MYRMQPAHPRIYLLTAKRWPRFRFHIASSFNTSLGRGSRAKAKAQKDVFDSLLSRMLSTLGQLSDRNKLGITFSGRSGHCPKVRGERVAGRPT